MDACRRRVLATLGVGAIGALAGCLGSGGDASPPTGQVAKLVPDDGDEGDAFGVDVAVSDDGTTAVVGASRDEDPNGEGAGSAYVMTESGGNWQQEAKLVPDDGEGADPREGTHGDYFGRSVALSSDGRVALVGARGDELLGAGRDRTEIIEGAAYVFAEASGRWEQQAKLVPDHGDTGEYFSESVAVSGDGTTAVVGVPEENRTGTGAAYVFESTGGEWSQSDKLVGDDGGEFDRFDRFGQSVSVSTDGRTVLVGSPNVYEDARTVGSATVFTTESGGRWNRRQATLGPDDGAGYGFFGTSVALSGDASSALVGSPLENAVYLFDRASGWSKQKTIDGSAYDVADEIGDGVSVSGDGSTVVTSGAGDTSSSVWQPGSAYILEESGNTWSKLAQFAPDDGEDSSSLTLSVAMSDDGTTAVVGFPRGADPNGEDAGSAYVFG
jgi:hypothetical protein